MTDMQGREGGYNGPVYLLVVDRTEEFKVALAYAARLAQANGARVALLHVMDTEDFQHWGDVEKRMHEEYRAEAEKELWEAARTVNEISALFPALYLEEGGNIAQTVLDVLEHDPRITKLILGGAPQSGNPGPLVSYFSGKGLNRLNVPLTIVPGDIKESRLDDLV